jgi:hypothetical protein
VTMLATTIAALARRNRCIGTSRSVVQCTLFFVVTREEIR